RSLTLVPFIACRALNRVQIRSCRHCMLTGADTPEGYRAVVIASGFPYHRAVPVKYRHPVIWIIFDGFDNEVFIDAVAVGRHRLAHPDGQLLYGGHYPHRYCYWIGRFVVAITGLCGRNAYRP